MALDLNAVMDDLGEALATIAGLRVKDYAGDSAAPPAAMVGLPTLVDYDATHGRGLDRVVLPVTILVGKVSDRAARDALAGYVAGSGAQSVKAALDGRLDHNSQSSVRVMEARTEVVTIGALEYLGAIFDVEVFS